MAWKVAICLKTGFGTRNEDEWDGSGNKLQHWQVRVGVSGRGWEIRGKSWELVKDYNINYYADEQKDHTYVDSFVRNLVADIDSGGFDCLYPGEKSFVSGFSLFKHVFLHP